MYLSSESSSSVLDDSVFIDCQLFRIALEMPGSLNELYDLTKDCGPLARKHAHEIYDAIESAVCQLRDSSLSRNPADEGEKRTDAQEERTKKVSNSLNGQVDSENKQYDVAESRKRNGNAPEKSADTQGVQDYSGPYTECLLVSFI